MRIAILEAGSPPERLADGHPGYGAMTAGLIGEEHACTIFDVRAGQLPAEPDAFQAYAITGSAASVYDPLPWIAALIGFLRTLPPEAKCVGLCFGHQVMAEAFGGRVEKAESGWGLGLHAYDVVAPMPFMDAATPIAVPVSHQDQVVVRPPGAQVVAGSAFTPNGALAYADRAALSFQCHPEFSPAYARALIAGHRAGAENPKLVATALASLDAPHDSARVGGWIRRFLDAA